MQANIFSNQIVHTCTDSFPYISSVYVPELCNNLHHYVGFYVPTTYLSSYVTYASLSS